MTDTNAAVSSPVAQNVADTSPQGRKLVIFADGTGNAFSTQESNVWRLYEALDRTKPDQVAYYIKGVGTAGWKPLAALDGASGFGVPGNVRKLYQFLCWNWKPGDKIYIFGFSRGAFTARTLAALIAWQGLVPAVIDDKAVTHAEMERNAMAAWRTYRSDSVGWKSLPTVWVSRWIRDLIVAGWHRVRRHRLYSEIRDVMAKETETIPERRRDGVNVEFLGLFDTVEAYGVPIEELRLAIDYAIWPISFRNYELHWKVKRARHALALDDERIAFHPLRFDQSREAEDSDRIKEVWFAGVHSDVGGGYPDGNLSYVPLVWMAGQIEDDLRFQPGRIEEFRGYQSAIGPTHDSRAGSAMIYRYGPRPIEGAAKDGGPPVVHHSVVTRMQQGCDNYAPVTLPANAKVWLPGPRSETADMTELPQKRVKQMPALPANATDERKAKAEAAVRSVEAMPVPDAEVARQTLDTVWWRRVAWFCMLWALVLVAAWPVLARWLVTTAGEASRESGAVTAAWWNKLAVFNDRLVNVIDSTATVLGGFLPSYAMPWLDAARKLPLLTIALAIVIGAVLTWNSSLRDRIHERARLAWFRPGRKVPPTGEPSKLLGFARFMRTNPAMQALYGVFTKFVFPVTAIAGFVAIVIVAGGRSYFNYYAGRETKMCVSGGDTVVTEQVATAKTLFETKSMCWGSGLVVEKDRKYRLWITMEQPWFDRTIMSGVNGFTLYSVPHVVALPVRRWFSADWFQPIVRFGKWGTDEMSLTSIDERPPDALPRTYTVKVMRNGEVVEVEKKRPVRVHEVDEFAKERARLLPNRQEPGGFEPIEKEMLLTANKIWGEQDLAKTLVAEFVAKETGELYLYVNDAIQIIPGFGPLSSYYNNNTGTATVKIQRIPLPPVPAN